MEFSNLFIRVLELSPFVAALLYFLFTVWNSMQKKDDALTATMKDHQAQQLQMQKESIMAQNNSADANRQIADANRQLSLALGDFKDHISAKLEDIDARLPRNGATRRLPTAPHPAPAA
ncbi:hypothetical protein [Spirosoma areae]